ncbi:MAG: response regulator [Desulfobacterales bacterium]
MARILLVDDETSILDPLRDFLIKIEHEVVGMALSGEESVSLARELKPDLVVMDIRLPGEIDGIDAAGIIKKDLGIPTIFITGHIRGDYIDRARQLDPLGFILKPFKMSEVQAAIEIALQKALRIPDASAQEE